MRKGATSRGFTSPVGGENDPHSNVEAGRVKTAGGGGVRGRMGRRGEPGAATETLPFTLRR
jgi:hypothetical protein